MSTWYKVNKVMSIIVLSLSIILCIALAVLFFIASSGYHIGGVYLWYGIIMLLVGIPFSIGFFALWNMLIDWYAKSTLGKTLPPPIQYGVPMQYTYPQPPKPPQAGLWHCPYCGIENDMNSGFCINCGKPRQ